MTERDKNQLTWSPFRSRLYLINTQRVERVERGQTEADRDKTRSNIFISIFTEVRKNRFFHSSQLFLERKKNPILSAGGVV